MREVASFLQSSHNSGDSKSDALKYSTFPLSSASIAAQINSSFLSSKFSSQSLHSLALFNSAAQNSSAMLFMYPVKNRSNILLRVAILEMVLLSFLLPSPALSAGFNPVEKILPRSSTSILTTPSLSTPLLSFAKWSKLITILSLITFLSGIMGTALP